MRENSKRELLQAGAIVLSLLCTPVAYSQSPDAVLAGKLQHLIEAYPDALAGIDGKMLVWKDGTRMSIDDGFGAKTATQRLEAPDIKDMLFEAYPAGSAGVPPAADADPGRARPEAFFAKMYGDCRKGEVQAGLVGVVWLPKKWGRTLQVNARNGVAEKLAAISRELDALPESFDRYLYPPAGTYNCRAIAGTTRISAHGHGIAIDLATRWSDYWRWSKAGTDGKVLYRNRFPMEIVAIFERHGFIWGGKWAHYDTMHFEYRPELLPAAGKNR